MHAESHLSIVFVSKMTNLTKGKLRGDFLDDAEDTSQINYEHFNTTNVCLFLLPNRLVTDVWGPSVTAVESKEPRWGKMICDTPFSQHEATQKINAAQDSF